MKKLHPVTQILIVLLVVAFFVAQLYITRWSNEAGWARTQRLNAHLSYWTLRTNAESSRKFMSQESYDELRRKIDADWKQLNPELEIPDKPEAK